MQLPTNTRSARSNYSITIDICLRSVFSHLIGGLMTRSRMSTLPSLLTSTSAQLSDGHSEFDCDFFTPLGVPSCLMAFA